MSYDSRPDTLEHIREVQKNLGGAIENLIDRSNLHDASKLESPEKEIFDAFTPKLNATTYGSEEYRGYLAGMGEALDHHYAENSHHPEHYRWRCGVCDRRCTQAEYAIAPLGPDDSGTRYCPDCCRHGMIYEAYLKPEVDKGLHGMSLLDIIEMLCDWRAATMRHADGDLLRSIEVNQKRFGYTDEMRRILLNTVAELEF